MKQKNFLILMIALLMTTFAFSQVTGTVTDDSSQPLMGVSIVIKDTATGAVTDFDGNYSIDASDGDILVFSYIGYEPQEVTASGTSINITMVSGVSLDEIILVGTRNPGRTALNSAVPVDVLNVSEIVESSPQITVTELLNYAAPSFSSNTQTISDGTDHIAPASLRGLGPDQVLVLINGKRRHKSSLVNVNGTFGRGSVGTDLDAIPVASIDRIEILRDGAAAQYGSDAIAGVINIVLKDATNELALSITTGANFTSENPDDDVDGEKFNLGANYGLPIGDKGFINFTGNFDFRGATNRMKEWEGQIFNGYNAIERLALEQGLDISDLSDEDVRNLSQGYFSQSDADIINGLNEEELHTPTQTDEDGNITFYNPLWNNVTDAELAARGQERKDYNMRVGQSEVRGGNFFANMEIPVSEDLVIYSFGGIGFKNGNSAGFYRLPYQNRTYTPARLNGFLPEINSTIKDKALAIGIKGVIGDWNVDFSHNYGNNEFSYNIANSLNASLEKSTPFNAYAGGFEYGENTTNIDLSRYYEDIMAGLNFAFGAEYRVETYGIFAGEEISYAQYNTSGNIHDPNDPESMVPTDFFGSARPGGIQVFPGFKPENEVDANRNSIAGYVDVEADFTEKFRATAAVRYENFSDFGGTINGKISFLGEVTDNINVRGSVQTGFRAPSLHQIHFNSTSTIFVDGVPSEVGIFPNTSRVARILGVDELKEETSIGFTAGFTARIPDWNLKFTVDGYFVGIDDRVVLSGQFEPQVDEDGEYIDEANAELAALLAEANATAAAFFTNAVDTETYGLDVVVEQDMRIGDNMKLANTLSFTFSQTEVVGTNIPTAIEDAGLADTFFDRTSRIYIESAVPNTQGTLANNLSIGQSWNIYLRNTYFGEVEEATNNIDPLVNRTYGGKLITDLSAGYNFSEAMRLTVGANNLFDIYPDKADDAFRSSGRFIYSRRSKQFGVGGRYIFARINILLK